MPAASVTTRTDEPLRATAAEQQLLLAIRPVATWAVLPGVSNEEPHSAAAIAQGLAWAELPAGIWKLPQQAAPAQLHQGYVEPGTVLKDAPELTGAVEGSFQGLQLGCIGPGGSERRQRAAQQDGQAGQASGQKSTK